MHYLDRNAEFLTLA